MPLNHSEIYPNTLKYLLILDCTLAILPHPALSHQGRGS